jgi:hypothetical protein
MGVPKDIQAFYGIKGWIGEGLYFKKRKSSVVVPETMDGPAKTVETEDPVDLLADETMHMMAPDGDESMCAEEGAPLLFGLRADSCAPGNDSMDMDEPVLTDNEGEEEESLIIALEERGAGEGLSLEMADDQIVVPGESLLKENALILNDAEDHGLF